MGNVKGTTMLRGLIGTVVRGAMLGAVVIGAKKLWERQHTRPMKEPLKPGTSYNGTAASFAGTPAFGMETTPDEVRPAVDIDRKESPALTRP